MLTELNFQTFRYFIECYYYSFADHTSPTSIIKRFKEAEYQENSVNLLIEAREILRRGRHVGYNKKT